MNLLQHIEVHIQLLYRNVLIFMHFRDESISQYDEAIFLQNAFSFVYTSACSLVVKLILSAQILIVYRYPLITDPLILLNFRTLFPYYILGETQRPLQKNNGSTRHSFPTTHSLSSQMIGVIFFIFSLFDHIDCII